MAFSITMAMLNLTLFIANCYIFSYIYLKQVKRAFFIFLLTIQSLIITFSTKEMKAFIHLIDSENEMNASSLIRAHRLRRQITGISAGHFFVYL